MKLTCNHGGELRGICPQLRSALGVIARREAQLKRLRAKPRKHRPGKVLFRGWTCPDRDKHQRAVCLTRCDMQCCEEARRFGHCRRVAVVAVEGGR